MTENTIRCTNCGLGFDKAFNSVFGRSDDAVNAVGSGK